MQTQDLSYQLNNELIETSLKSHPGIKVSLEVFSLENVYTVPFGKYEKKGNTYRSNVLVWGDEEVVNGNATLKLKSNKDNLLIEAKAKLDKKIRSIKIRLDNLPLGKLLSLSSGEVEVTEYGLHKRYPEGWRDLSHPLLVFEISKDKYLYIRCLDKTVERKDFFIKKMGDSMRVDVVQEQRGNNLHNQYTIPAVEVGFTKTKEEIYAKQREYIEKTFDVAPYEESKIVPSWLPKISLVVIMHMESFTGHIFHTYESAYQDVLKLTKMIPGERILVYFPGWEGRYYYKYGNYTPDERLGGEQGLKDCISKIQKLGCKTMSMVGMNIANKNVPAINKIYKDAEFQSVSGAKYHNGSVDWEGAHHYDFNELVNLNIANKKWADELFNQVKDASLKYGFDGVFLDIAACYVNDKKHTLFPGVCEFCDRLRTIKEDFLVSGEAFYDGLLKAIPLFQSGHTDGSMNYHNQMDEELFSKYAREFGHLCLGDPSRGSSGVHELGTNTDWKVPYQKGLIPTLSLVENSIELAPEKVKEIIDDAIRYSKEFAK